MAEGPRNSRRIPEGEGRMATGTSGSQDGAASLATGRGSLCVRLAPLHGAVPPCGSRGGGGEGDKLGALPKFS